MIVFGGFSPVGARQEVNVNVIIISELKGEGSRLCFLIFSSQRTTKEPVQFTQRVPNTVA